MSRGGRHGTSIRIEKSYWLFDTENKSYKMDVDNKRPRKEDNPIPEASRKRSQADNNRSETQRNPPPRQERNVKRKTKIELKNHHETDSDRKRKGSEVNGPPNKKIRKDNVSSGEQMDSERTVPHQLNQNKPKKSSAGVSTRNGQPRIGSSPSMKNFIQNELFDDVESIGSEYDREASFIRTLFNDIDNVASDITEVSNENNFFANMLNIFENDDQDDDENDEDRVIITEIFDDDEPQPEKPAN